MITHLSHTFLSAVLRMARAPQSTLSRVAARISAPKVAADADTDTPDHIVTRLESVFDAMSELSSQPDVGSAFELACEALLAELPSGAMAAGVYDIDSDEVRIIAARGPERDMLCGAVLPRARCLVGYAAESAVITDGEAHGSDWLGERVEGDTVLLCPIRHDANLLGLLALANPLCAAHFTEDDLEPVSYVADQLAGFIQAHR